MSKMRLILSGLLLLPVLMSQAQIGYQVSLLNTATGEPRANENVQVSVSITDAQGTSVYDGTQTAATNDFGILSLTVGNASTFDNVDWTKLPLYISATVDGILVGRSQILNVPVAEYAKRTGSLTKEILCSKTWSSGSYNITFNPNGGGTYQTYNSSASIKWYIIRGDYVAFETNPFPTDPSRGEVWFYVPEKDCFLCNSLVFY